MNLKSIWKNFLSCGISEEEVIYSKLTQIKFLNFLGLLGSSVSIFMALFHLYIKDDSFGAIYHFIGVVLAWSDLIYFRISKNYEKASSAMILIVVYIAIFFLIDGGVETEGLIFLPFLPIVAYFLKGSKIGLRWSFFFGLIIVISAILINFNFISSPYSVNTLINATPLYILFSAFLYFYEIRKEKNTKIIENKSRDLKSLNKKLEEKVLNKTKELENITDNMAEGLFVLDLDSKVKYLNPTAEKIFGYKKDEVLNHYIDPLIKPRDENGTNLTIDNCPILNAIKNKETYKSDNLIFTTKEQKEINVSLSASPFMQNRNIIGAIVVFHDITENKKQEQELKTIYQGLKLKQIEIEKLNATLEKRVKEEIEKNREKEHILIQQSKMASMGEMIGNIAHQWRQPLNAIGLILQKLQYSYKRAKLNDEVMDKSVEKGMFLVNKMSTTIDDFRNFFKPNKEKMTFNVKDNILDSCAILEAGFKHNSIKVEFMIDENISLYGYPNEFSQVILNILNNAKDVFIEKCILDRRVLIDAKESHEYIEISILDNAGGIKKEIIDRVFEPYFSTKETNKGTGIGLYMSKMIIEENMGGELSVQNYNGGAKFNIKFNKIN